MLDSQKSTTMELYIGIPPLESPRAARAAGLSCFASTCGDSARETEMRLMFRK